MEIRIEDSFRDGRFGDLAFLHAPVGLVVTENRVIRDCNHTFAEMFGYVREDLQNRVFSILYPTDAEFDNIRDRGVDALRRTNTYWDERIMARKDGSLFWCRVRGHSFTPDEPLMRAVWSFADLSGDYRIVLATPPPHDHLPVHVELNRHADVADPAALAGAVEAEIKRALGATARVTVHPAGHFPVTEGKTKRVIRSFP